MVKNVGMSCGFVKCLKTSGEDLRDLGKGAEDESSGGKRREGQALGVQLQNEKIAEGVALREVSARKSSSRIVVNAKGD